MDRRLTTKQELFVDYYLGDANGNGTQAARLAGYAGDGNVLNQMAMDNLRNPIIASRVRERMIESRASSDRIVEELTSIIEIPNERFFSAGKESKVSLADKVRALELLGKRLRMFVDRTESTTTETKRIEIISIEVAKPRIIESIATESLPMKTE